MEGFGRDYNPEEPLFRPSGEELLQNPETLAGRTEEAAREHGAELRDVLPVEVSERLDDHARSVEAELLETFGTAEIPRELTEEMSGILAEVAKDVETAGYAEEIDEKLTDRLRELAVRTSSYQEGPRDIRIAAVPEEGFRVSFTDKNGQKIERTMSEEEQDLLFNMEMWADQFNQSRNAEGFREALAEAKTAAEKLEGEAKTAAVHADLVKTYRKFGFTDEQIEKLMLLTDDGELPEMAPEGKDPGVSKLEVLKDVWQRYLSGEEKTRYLKLAGAIVGVGAAEGMLPSLMRYMMDSGSAQTAALFAAGFIGGSAGLGWIKKKLALGLDQFVNEVAERPGGLNERLSQDLVFQPGEKMAETDQRGRLMTAMRRGQSAFREVLSSVAKVTAPSVATAATGIGMMMATDWRLGLASLASAPIAVAIARRAQQRARPLLNESFKTEDQTAQEVEEQIGAHMEIVLSGMRDDMGPRLQALIKKQNELTHQRGKVWAGMDFQSGALLNPMIVAGLTTAGVALRGLGVQDSGKIVAALVYSGQFRNSFDAVVRQQARMLESCASVVEMEEVFNGYAEEEKAADEKRVGASALPDYAIDLKNVSLKVGDKKLVDGISMSIPAGGTARIEGMSGHGKTTLTKLMAGYYQPSEGEITIGGVKNGDIKRTGPDSIYSHIAYLSQHPYVFDSGDLRENLRFGNPDVKDEDMRQVLKELKLEERFAANGQIDLGGKVVGLSGGEKTRIGLARALLKVRSQENGGIVFLDEPTEGLDEETEAEVAEILVREKQKHPKITFIVVSHRRSFIEELAKQRGDRPGLDIQRVKLEKGKIKE